MSPPPSPHFRKGSSRVAVGVLWVFITLAVMVVTGVGQYLKTGKFDLVDRVIWEIGWLGWAPLTFMIAAICRRHPITRQRRLPGIVRLAIIGGGIVAAQIAFDFACNVTLGWLLRGTPFMWMHLLYIVVFKVHVYYGVYWMIVGAAHAVEYHRRYRETEWISSQLEAKLAHAELGRLKAQLQPHFLFNAHHAIVALMLKRDNEAAIRMLTRLSDLLRISLARSGQQFVTLREELETLRLYLEIQHERFRDRLTIALVARPELEAAEVPHLLFQPLVENALHHGLEDVTENARLEVAVSREADTLVCTVRDNGAGFGADGEAPRSPVNGNGNGIGLANTRERLQQLYGAHQSLVIASTAGAGCAVTIRIPYRAPAPPARPLEAAVTTP